MIGFLSHLCFLKTHYLPSAFQVHSGSSGKCAILGRKCPSSFPTPTLLSNRHAYLVFAWSLPYTLSQSWVLWDSVLMGHHECYT